MKELKSGIQSNLLHTFPTQFPLYKFNYFYRQFHLRASIPYPLLHRDSLGFSLVTAEIVMIQTSCILQIQENSTCVPMHLFGWIWAIIQQNLSQ